ncbi:sensor domain-containing diguanylate cyclase [Chromobacterium sp. IIBBL 290-4]|uniref:sensor domain-containing diguanylate cyclase n=1 Tax=Chromobacterium sp. IIBBL 290-4 TaxID=2953890 RepID=UPI0020B6F2CD|nr:sensor domain-containing diguanylate cyclase [Chromobacterium sp. IIBBL 290-4]UTH72822.1 sensor domain-containing diguanylate cyclase [Chromobacterium sp. IIBBL 290-4]
MEALQILQPLFDTVQGSLLLTEPESGRILSSNQLAGILLACPHNELLGRSIYEFLADKEDENNIRQELERNNMIYNRGMLLRTATGRSFDVQLSVRKVMLDGVETQVFSFMDRTEAKVMSQLLDFERQLVERSLNIVRSLKEDGDQQDNEDKLTGVIGMHRLMTMAHNETTRARRYGAQLSGLVLELVNVPEMVPKEDDGSAYNHLLRLASSLCLQSTRDSDVVARRAEGSFIVLLPNTDMTGANELGRRLIKALRQLTFIYQGAEHQAAACVGLSALRQGENSPTALLDRLDQALGKAREGGANYIIKLP